MSKVKWLISAAVSTMALAGIAVAPAVAQSTGYYAGKQVKMIIGFGPGGGYDHWARMIASHLGKHLPGHPTVISENMPGAGSYVAASYIYNVAPKDGTVLAAIARDAAIGPLTGAPGAKFDPLKISWIGTPATETNVCLSFHTAKVKTVQDLYKEQLIVGDTGPGTGTRTYPKVLKPLLGMKFKLVSGFRSSANVFLAMERGEVDGICESYDSIVSRQPDWIKNKTINLLFQGGAEPNPELKGVPFILDLAKTDEQKQAIKFIYAGQGIGRPYVAPPNLPPERLKMLREGFAATLKDPEFLAEAKRSKFQVDPRGGEYLLKLMQEIYATPKPLVQKIGEWVK